MSIHCFRDRKNGMRMLLAHVRRKTILGITCWCIKRFIPTYVAERNLEPAKAPKRIVHPFVEALFSGFDGELYQLRQQAN